MNRVLSNARPARGESLIRVPAFGLTVRVRVDNYPDQSMPTVIETSHADGGGPPVYRREQAEIFVIVTGRYLFEVEGDRFIARRGDLVSVPGGVSRSFTNVTGTPARQHVFIQPGMDAAAYFRELAQVSRPEALLSELQEFGQRWGVQFLAPPLRARDADVPGGLG